jgi:RNA polymerase sigma-70 factor (ECF subfamily)
LNRRQNGHADERVSERFRDSLVSAIPNLRAFAISLCRDATRADDLVQETLLKAWSHANTFEDGTNFKAWLFTILRNTYFSELRKVGHKVREAEEGDAAELAVPGEQHGHMDLVDVSIAMEQLSPEQREAVTLVAAEGFSYEEAARVCGCEVGTVKSRVNRARMRLVKLLGLTEAEAGSRAAAVERVAAPSHGDR